MEATAVMTTTLVTAGAADRCYLRGRRSSCPPASPCPGNFAIPRRGRSLALSATKSCASSTNKDFLRSAGKLRIGVGCSAVLGSSNGNGRPGSGGIQPSEDGYDSGRLAEGLPTGGFDSQDAEIDTVPNLLSKRRGRRPGRESRDMRGTAAVQNQGEDPFRILDDGRKVYLDELDVMTLLEPPPFLRPLPSVFYNHAAFLWKKIGDIPEERRHRLLDLLLPRQIAKMWELANLRYEDPDLFVENAADMLPRPDVHIQGKPMIWDGRVTQVPWYLKPFSRFEKAFFIGDDKKVYGRVITGPKILRSISNRVPLYFEALHAESVTATEEPCDLVLEYGDGQMHLRGSTPPGFPNPAKHLPPFNDKACDYIRAVGPGVLVGKTWIEGRELDKVPRPLFGDIMMVRRFRGGG